MAGIEEVNRCAVEIMSGRSLNFRGFAWETDWIGSLAATHLIMLVSAAYSDAEIVAHGSQMPRVVLLSLNWYNFELYHVAANSIELY